MKLLSLNISLPKTVVINGRSITSGIFKESVEGTVRLRKLKLEGDGQADLKHHGGEYKAVYSYPYEHYSYWQKILGSDEFHYGSFGENFTTSGLMERDAQIGSIYSIGTAEIMIAQPRTPCFKLEMCLNVQGFRKTFLESGLTGIYMSVIREGEVCADDIFECVSTSSYSLSVHDIWRICFTDNYTETELRQANEIPWLAPEFKKPVRERLNI